MTAYDVFVSNNIGIKASKKEVSKDYLNAFKDNAGTKSKYKGLFSN